MAAPVLTLSKASSPSDSSDAIPQAQISHIHALSNLSRNTSVISTSSSSSSSSSVIQTPVRPRPLRTFSNHSNPSSRARSPTSPTTPRGSAVPLAYLPRQYDNESYPSQHDRLSANLVNAAASVISNQDGRSTPSAGLRSGQQSPTGIRSRSSSAARTAATGAESFDFGDVLGSGSYSSVSIVMPLLSKIPFFSDFDFPLRKSSPVCFASSCYHIITVHCTYITSCQFLTLPHVHMFLLMRASCRSSVPHIGRHLRFMLSK